MFGYININQKILSEENKNLYQSYYCGLCRRLKSNCGTKGQMLLAYDMTFLVVLLTGLYELTDEESEITCALHPTKKRKVRYNEATDYAADMNVILAYHNLVDDWKDEKNYTKLAFAKMLDKDYCRIKDKYPRQVRAIEEFMRRTEKLEKEHETNLDVVAGLTGGDAWRGVLLAGRRMAGRAKDTGILFSESSYILWMPMKTMTRMQRRTNTIRCLIWWMRARKILIRSAACF